MVNHVVSNTGLEVIIAASSGGLLAQIYKFLTYLLIDKRLNFRLLVQTGGMPSSHSSTMSSMATSVGIMSGWSSIDFAIALGVALVVMYDAAGLRRAAGKMASVLNQITDDFYRHQPEELPERLRELLGHTPFEVFIGALFGICWSFIVHDILKLTC